MIRFTLRCADAHEFDSWFASAAAYDGLRGAGHLACPVCGSTTVDKALMAPAIRPARKPAPDQRPSLKTPASEAELALAALRRRVEETSDYVGLNFVTEVRAMHEGAIPERPIYGEARSDEARQLIEDGVPVAPLPFLPARKTN